MKIYFDFRDWWIGYYRGETHHYVCLFPTVVIRWNRKKQQKSLLPPIDFKYNSIPVLVDEHMPEDRVYLINQNACDLVGEIKNMEFTRQGPREAMTVNPKKWTDLIRTVEEMKKWPSSPA